MAQVFMETAKIPTNSHPKTGCARVPLLAQGINILDSSSAVKNRKLDKSCTSNPKSEVSDWTVPATRRFNGGGDDPAEFLVFRDKRRHFVVRKQAISHDLLQP